MGTRLATRTVRHTVGTAGRLAYSRVARGVGISVVPIPWYVPDDDAGPVVDFAERVQIERRELGRS
jgi:hypothetical protein